MLELPSDAAIIYRQGLAVSTNGGKPEHRATLLSNLGAVLHETGQTHHAEAEEAYRAALALVPNLEHARTNLETLQSQQRGRPPRDAAADLTTRNPTGGPAVDDRDLRVEWPMTSLDTPDKCPAAAPWEGTGNWDARCGAEGKGRLVSFMGLLPPSHGRLNPQPDPDSHSPDVAGGAGSVRGSGLFGPPEGPGGSRTSSQQHLLTGRGHRSPASAAVWAALAARRLPFPQGSKFAVAVAGVLSAAECRSLVAMSEVAGYEPALLDVGGGRDRLAYAETRRSARHTHVDPMLAMRLYERVRVIVPSPLQGRCPVGLNERLRFLRYTDGDFFAQHMDGSYHRPVARHPPGHGLPAATTAGKPATGGGANATGAGRGGIGEFSILTFLLYLNDGGGVDFSGGVLRLEQGGGEARVTPGAGLVLLHDHQILHEATPVTNGTRFVIRTDVMYARCGGGL